MKTIAILLLLCGTAWGQYRSISDTTYVDFTKPWRYDFTREESICIQSWSISPDSTRLEIIVEVVSYLTNGIDNYRQPKEFYKYIIQAPIIRPAPFLPFSKLNITKIKAQIIPAQVIPERIVYEERE